MMMKKRFTVAPANRLVIRKDGKKIQPKGAFRVDGNVLSYIISESSSWRRQHVLPRKITFKGAWSLRDGHNLALTLYQTKEQYGGERLYIKSELAGVTPGALIFSVGAKGEEGVYSVRLLKLRGKWKTDAGNRLQFLIQKTSAAAGSLTLQGSWQVKHNILIYTYKSAGKQQRCVYKGYWQISEKNRLVYVLDAKEKSYFSFKAHLQTPTIRESKGAIKYRIGVGATRYAAAKDTIVTLYGVWKLMRKGGASFEIDYGSAGVKAVRFGTTLRVSHGRTVSLELTNSRGKPLGMRITLSGSFSFPRSRFFLRASRSRQDSRLETGVVIPW